MPFNPTQEWVDSLVKKVCDTVAVDACKNDAFANFTPIPTEKMALLTHSGILERMVRGYVTEFISQTDQNIPDLNTGYDPKFKDDPEQDFAYWKPYDERTIAAIVHTKASVKKAIEAGLTKDQLISLCRAVITTCIEKMRDPYFNHEQFTTLDEQAKIAAPYQASVARDKNALYHFIDLCFEEKNRSYTQNL